MAEKKKKKDKNNGRKGIEDGNDSNKLTKDEDAIARFVRFNCPTNASMFEGNEVHYFSGKKAVDVLVESKKYGATAKTPKFLNSDAAEEFLQTLLAKGLFFRAKKLVPKKKEKPLTDQQQKTEKGARDISKSPPSGAKPLAEKRQPKEVEDEGREQTKDEEDDGAKEEEDDDPTKKRDQQQEEEKRRKKKVKLLFHDVQKLDVSSSDVYVWVFDPTPLWKKCVGILIVLGTIGGCLFPLWPDWLRLGIYYLSVTGIALFGLLLGVAFARTILFGLIWLFTLGRHHLWLLPNLLEECGFFESFKPAYTHEYVPGGIFAKKEPKSKKKKEDDNSKKDIQSKGEEDDEQQQNNVIKRDEKEEGSREDATETEGAWDNDAETTPLLLLSQNKPDEGEKTGQLQLAVPAAPFDPTALKEEKCIPTHAELGRSCSSIAESESQHSSKKDGTSGSDEEGEEETQTGTDDSNSWEKLSDDSHRSAECGKAVDQAECK